MRARLIRALLLSGASLAVMLTRPAAADEIRLLASNAVREAYQQALPAFEAATGHRVIAEWGGTLDIVKRAAARDQIDVIIVPSHRVDALVAQGAAVSRIDLAISRIGVASRRGAPRPDLKTIEGLKAALLAARSIVLSSGPSHEHMLALIRTMGIADAVQTKILQLKPGLSVGMALADGQGELGFTQISELLPIKDIDYLGPLPPEAQASTIFSAGLLPDASSSAAARALIRYLSERLSSETLTRYGLEVAQTLR